MLPGYCARAVYGARSVEMLQISIDALKEEDCNGRRPDLLFTALTKQCRAQY